MQNRISNPPHHHKLEMINDASRDLMGRVIYIEDFDKLIKGIAHKAIHPFFDFSYGQIKIYGYVLMTAEEILADETAKKQQAASRRKRSEAAAKAAAKRKENIKLRELETLKKLAKKYPEAVNKSGILV